MYIVTAHELYHAAGFTPTNYGSGSFTSRVNTTSHNHYTGSRVLNCANRSSIAIDTAKVHWSQSDSFFGPTDLMTPVIDSKTSWSKCTSEAIVEARPGWTSVACDDDRDCSTKTTCFRFGDSLGGFCSEALPRSSLNRQSSDRFPAFSVFVFVVVTFLAILRTCLAIRLKTKVP